jgi:hypothetical protein
MIDHSQSRIVNVSAHIVGNGVNGGKLRLSEAPLEIDDGAEVEQLLLSYFLSHFAEPEYYNFTSESSDFRVNPVFNYASAMLAAPQSFHENSINIAHHLYNTTLLPTIRSGELFVASVTGVKIQGQVMNAVGIFKSESKASFLKLNASSGIFKLKAEAGINTQKLDKGCLILDTDKETGFKVLVVDAMSKQEAKFWVKDFLTVTPCADNYFQTRNFMDLTRQYVDDMDEQLQVSKADKIDLLNRSLNFFKSRDQFDKHEFETEVLEDPDVIESFRHYERSMGDRDANAAERFEISAQAVRSQARVFKSVLKLDKNFHIYIHGNRELIEKGFDESVNKHYYKIYFDQET